jgi:hypothetical protein
MQLLLYNFGRLFSEEESGLGSSAGDQRQVDDGKGGQWRSVAIPCVMILLINKTFAFRNIRHLTRLWHG